MSSARRILVVTYWSLREPLVQAYTLPYVRLMLQASPRGSVAHLVTLEKDADAIGARLAEPGIVHHAFAYARFGPAGALMVLRVLWSLLRLIRRERIDAIHAWCTPAGALGYVLSVLSGRPLVIDSYEPHAEAMVENGTWKRGGAAHRILLAFERLQSRRAKELIACASGMQRYAAMRYGLPGDRPMHVKPACVDLDRFDWRRVKDPRLLRELDLEGKVVALYAGKFGGIYLDQEVFDLLRAAREHWGERLRVLLLTAHRPQELEPMMRKAGLDPSIFIIRHVPHEQVPEYMGLADFALTPVKPVPTKAFCTPIKDGEYWAMGLPVIITAGISDDSAIIAREGIGSVLEELSVDAYRKAVREVDALLRSATRRALYDRIRPVAERFRTFAIAAAIYQRIYGR
ncbi:MAG: glycosyltransferase [Flavobacteriales bacterium]